jgi:hypothetical protein
MECFGTNDFDNNSRLIILSASTVCVCVCVCVCVYIYIYIYIYIYDVPQFPPLIIIRVVSSDATNKIQKFVDHKYIRNGITEDGCEG